MNFQIFRDFSRFFQNFFKIFLNLKWIYFIKIDFINRAGDVAKSGASDQTAIVNPSSG